MWQQWWDEKLVAVPIRHCHVCGSCGHGMIAMVDPDEVWKAHVLSRE